MKKSALFIIASLLFSQFIFAQCDLTSLSVTNVSATQVALDWNSTSATSFRVKYRISGTTSSWSPSNSNVTQTTTLTNSNTILNTLSPNTTYEWRVRTTGCNPYIGWVDGPNIITLPLILGCTDSTALNYDL